MMSERLLTIGRMQRLWEGQRLFCTVNGKQYLFVCTVNGKRYSEEVDERLDALCLAERIVSSVGRRIRVALDVT